MVRISKQEERRMKSPKKRKNPAKKTGSKKDNLALGFKEHLNAAPSGSTLVFIPKIG